MTLTENYGLKKPDLTDPVDISVLNENLDILDSEMKKREDAEGTSAGMTDEERAQLEQNTQDIAAIQDEIDASPVTVSEDGYTDIAGQRQAADIQFTRTVQNIAIDITMQGAIAYNGNLELDEKGFPVKYTENGLEVSMGFTGFDDLLTTLWEGGSY